MLKLKSEKYMEVIHMKVLLINGSPHADGCTATALGEIAKTLNNEGVETEIFHIGASAVRGCIACGGCHRNGNGRCVFDGDPVNTALEKMENADGLVIGSPVYYGSANGTLISLLDRMFFAGDCFKNKPACVICSARRGGTTATYDELNKYIGISGMLMVPSCYWNMVHGSNKEEVVKDEEGMRIMRVLGKNMAWLLKMLDATKDTVPLPTPEPPARTNFIR